MNTNVKLILLISIVAVIGVGYTFISRDTDPSITDNVSEQVKQFKDTPNPLPTEQNTNNKDNQNFDATIMYTESGFRAKNTTVNSGDIVRVLNRSSSVLQFNSDSHPTHTDKTELNLGIIQIGESKYITITAKGAFGFHNHLKPSVTGTLIVK